LVVIWRWASLSGSRPLHTLSTDEVLDRIHHVGVAFTVPGLGPEVVDVAGSATQLQRD